MCISAKKFVRTILPLVVLLSLPVYFVFSNRRIALLSRRLDAHSANDSAWHTNETLDRLVKRFVNSLDALSPKPNEIKKIKNITNPCWKRADSKAIDCLPMYYFGGFAKCSTTDIWRRLLLHPQVFNTGRTFSSVNPTPMKEYRYWTRDLCKLKIPLKEYTSMFGKVSEHPDSIVGDGSVGMFPLALFISKTAPRFPKGSDLHQALANSEILPAHLIVQYVPQAKFIVMVREPAQRLYSFYLHMYRTFKYEDRPGWQKPSAATFHRLVLDAIQEFNECRVSRSARDCAYDELVVRTDQDSRVALHIGLYVIFIRDALKLIPRGNVAVFRSEDYIRDRKDVLQKIVNFLGLNTNDQIIENMARAEMHIFDQGDPKDFSERISPVEQAPMWSETRDILREFYRPFNEQLAVLLNDDRYLFKDVMNGR